VAASTEVDSVAPVDEIRYEVARHIATITIDRPAKRNAMTGRMTQALYEAVDRASQSSEVRAVVLTGSGGSFCAGADLQDLSTRSAKERAVGPPSWFILRCAKPVIAAIDGVAVGMGAEFTSMCDVRIASTAARFAWNFAARGLVPDTGAGSWLLPRLLGPQTALRLLYSGVFVSAQEALELGYVYKVVEPADLLAAATDEATQWTKGSPLALRSIRELVYQGLDRTAEEHLAEHRKALAACFASADHREGVTAFLERRDPIFTDQ
jgi:enoyl-CoA hydratase/carnithine racemase